MKIVWNAMCVFYKFMSHLYITDPMDVLIAYIEGDDAGGFINGTTDTLI